MWVANTYYRPLQREGVAENELDLLNVGASGRSQQFSSLSAYTGRDLPRWLEQGTPHPTTLTGRGKSMVLGDGSYDRTALLDEIVHRAGLHLSMPG